MQKINTYRAGCCILASLVLLLSCPEGRADESGGAGNSSTFSIFFENDLFADTDRNYTNGVKLSWVSPDLTEYAKSDKLPKWSLPLVARLPFINEPGLKRNIAFSLGQNMYTPRDIARSDLITDDRPYGGWTYFGCAFHSKNDRRLDSWEVQLGMVGPDSRTDETQKLVHRLREIQRPNGWDNQINNEPGLAAVYEQKRRLFYMTLKQSLFAMDAISHFGGALGNVSIYGNIGAETRLGWNIPMDFGDSLIRPAGDTNAPFASGNERFGIYGFLSMDSRVVMRDIFLDGNTNSQSHSVDRKPLVADISAGVSLIIRGLKISYAQALRTREFRGQDRHHSFGSITVSYTF